MNQSFFPSPEPTYVTFEQARARLRSWIAWEKFPKEYLEEFKRLDKVGAETEEFRSLIDAVTKEKTFTDLRNQLHAWAWRRGTRASPALILFGNMEETYDNFVGPKHLTPWRPEKWEHVRSVAVWQNLRKLYKEEGGREISRDKLKYSEEELKDLFMDIMDLVATREAGHFIVKLPGEALAKKARKQKWKPVKMLLLQ